MLKRLYSQAGSKQSSGTVSGVTFGLDDIYEDDYGREASPRAAGRSLSRSAPPSKRELANDRVSPPFQRIFADGPHLNTSSPARSVVSLSRKRPIARSRRSLPSEAL